MSLLTQRICPIIDTVSVPGREDILDFMFDPKLARRANLTYAVRKSFINSAVGDSAEMLVNHDLVDCEMKVSVSCEVDIKKAAKKAKEGLKRFGFAPKINKGEVELSRHLFLKEVAERAPEDLGRVY